MGRAGLSSLCEIGPGRYAHASGALWIKAAQAILVADAHLGYGWAQRRRGELGPVADTKSHPRLKAVGDELAPKQWIFLGDLVHAPRPGQEERAAIEHTLLDLAASAEVVLVRGNHDRAFIKDFGHLGFTVVDCWNHHGLVALHGDKLANRAIPEGHLVVGHLHPVVKFKDGAGASQKVRVFLSSPGMTVMPAFSPYSGGFDVARGLPSDIAELWGDAAVEGIAVTGKSAMKIGPLRVRR